jgi:molybdate transport system permease protein
MGLVHLPLVIPPTVTGYILLLLFGRRGPLGRFLAEHLGIAFAFRWTGAALACAVTGFPLMVRGIRLSLEALARRLEDAPATLGLTLPLSLPGVIAGMILFFTRRMGEFGAQVPGSDAGALRLTLISIGTSMLALLIAEFVARRLSRILPGD